VKTRFSPAISPEDAASLYRAFIEDFFESITPLSKRGVHVFGAYTPAEALPAVRGLVPPEIELFPQPEGDLGQRMYGVCRALFEKGYERVVITGSDSPDLPPSYIESALSLLDRSDLVLGPASDGGYYLIAMKTLVREIFDDMAWSTPGVFEETVARARRMGLAVELTPPWHDMDRPEDLALLDGKRAVRSARLARTLLGR